MNKKITEKKTGIMASLSDAVVSALAAIGLEKIGADSLHFGVPPKAEMGDFAFGCFHLANKLGINPAEAAKKLAGFISSSGIISRVEVFGPYINFFLDRNAAMSEVLASIKEQGERYVKNSGMSEQVVMVEYLSPNTNKPLHLGHMRNGVIGTSVANLLGACGAEVLRANNINDRGIHIIRSMLAYKLCGNGTTPESEGKKGDHFVGEYYVRYSQEEKKAQAEWLKHEEEFWLRPEEQDWLKSHGIDLNSLMPEQKEKMNDHFQAACPLVAESYEMLRRWESGDPEVIALWKKMNQWVYEGFNETNNRLGFLFDRVYYESQTYTLGRGIIMDKVNKGIGRQNSDGSVVIDMSEAGLNGGRNGELPVVLIRRDGTSVYITQDVGLAVTRFREEKKLDGIIYVVAREQELHFKRVFELLKRYGYDWHSRLYHLSYGMVNLSTGKMKSREGTVVDADDLMNELRDLAFEAVQKSDSQADSEDLKTRAEAVALGALKFYLITVAPNKDMTFNPKESISFEGRTGPYIQYACTRISAIEHKARDLEPCETSVLQFEDAEYSLAKLLATMPDLVRQAASQYNPAILANGLYEIAKAFSVFYTNCPVIQSQGEERVYDLRRMELCKATRTVISQGLKILGIPVPERM